jgi:hypothetical protein
MKHYSIGVGSRSGVITLRGNVASEAQRHLAFAIAQQADGVRQVVDQLQLMPPPNHPHGVAPQPQASIDAKLMLAENEPYRPPLTKFTGAGFRDLAACLAIAAARKYLAADAGRFDVEFDVELDDGSRIVAQSVRPAKFQLESDLGTMTVPLRLVETIQKSGAANEFRVTLSNGDRVTGRIEFPAGERVHLIAAHGEMRVASTAIVGVTRRGDSKALRHYRHSSGAANSSNSANSLK